MDASFESWLRKELEQAKFDALSPDTWTRKKAQDRSDKLEVALTMLAEFSAF